MPVMGPVVTEEMQEKVFDSVLQHLKDKHHMFLFKPKYPWKEPTKHNPDINHKAVLQKLREAIDDCVTLDAYESF
jgi:hypothetical protein